MGYTSVIVLDTNVLSEVLKPLPSGVVVRWLAAQDPRAVFTTTITQAESLYGIEVLHAGKRRVGLLAARRCSLKSFRTESCSAPSHLAV